MARTQEHRREHDVLHKTEACSRCSVRMMTAAMKVQRNGARIALLQQPVARGQGRAGHKLHVIQEPWKGRAIVRQAARLLRMATDQRSTVLVCVERADCLHCR